MNSLKRSFNIITLGSIIIDLVIIFLGVFMISNPTVGIESALVILGVVLLINGIYSIIRYVMNPKSIFRYDLIYGILSVIASLFAIFKPFDVANFITVIIGIWLVITSIVKFLLSMEFRKVKQDSWVFDMTISALTFLLGIMLLINPFNGYMVLSTYAAIMISLYAAIDLVEQLLIRKRVKYLVEYISKK